MKRLNKGVFIVFEGIDGSGKSLQADMAARRLRADGYDVVELAEPTRGEWGTAIRAVLSGKADPVPPGEELELFIRDRRDNIRRNVGPALDSGRIVVQDRYYYSTIAYQGARGFSTGEIRRRHAGFLREPDLVIILDIAPGEAIRRIQSGRNSEFSIFEKQSYLEKVKAIYDGFAGPNVVRLDGMEKEDSVHARVMERIFAVIGTGPEEIPRAEG